MRSRRRRGRGIAGALGDLWWNVQRLWSRASSGQRMIAGGAALCLLVLTGTLTLMSMQPAPKPRATEFPPPPTFTATDVPTDTPLPTATLKPTATAHRSVVNVPKPPPIPKPPTPTPTKVSTPSGTPTATPTPCGPTAYQGGNPTQDQIRTALQAAATAYGLPVNLLYAVAWQESRWHQDVYSCDGGVGLMQIQYYLVNDFNHASYIINTPCGLKDTNYDATVMQDNAYLGAKFLKYLSCYYGFYAGTSGATLSNPGPQSVDYYYQEAQLQYPDTLNKDGSTNPNSYCVSVYNASPENPALPSTTKDTWSCPYDPYHHPASNPNPGALHTPDNTLLDVTVSAYNEGTGTLYSCGICNPGYVKSVEGYIPQFQSGALPVAS